MNAPGDSRGLPGGVRLTSPAALVATGFGVGLMRPAPGTWGSLAALPPGIAVMLLAGPWAVLAMAAVVFIAGLLATRGLLRTFPPGADTDDAAIVVDEIAGQLVALVPALHAPVLWVAAFLLFRLFDIWKPGPLKVLDKFPGGAWSVMLDDLAAGLLAAGGVWALAEAGLANV